MIDMASLLCIHLLRRLVTGYSLGMPSIKLHSPITRMPHHGPRSALYLARRLAPAMIAAGEGAIVASGNTSALRGKAGFAGFAPTKAAQRILAEAIARDVGPKGCTSPMS
jgi:NAD(P)-dependent dehydrogenase (short-subunit alcohol dehydrogenase family)